MEKTLKLQNHLLNKIAKKVDDQHNDSIIVDLDKSNLRLKKYLYLFT